MKICPKCNEKFDLGKFCKFCGTALQDEVQELYCSNCGVKLDSGAKFCSNCGTKVEQSKPAEDNKETSDKTIENKEVSKISDNEGVRECPVCHTEFGDSSMFCTKCGAQCGKNTLKAAPLNPNSWVNLSDYSLQMLINAENKSHNSSLQVEIGKRYFYGDKINENNLEAKKFFEKAANQENPIGLYYLASCFINGYGTEIDHNKGFPIIKHSLELDKNNGYAQNLLGDCYQYGWGTDIKIDYALQCYKKASEFGIPIASNSLGLLYLCGNGVAKDDSLAFKYFELAAEGNLDVGMFNLGYCYESSIGCNENPQKAFEWYYKSSEAGYMDGRFAVGRCLVNGYGCEKNTDYGMKLIQNLANNGHEDAQKWLEENNHGQLSQSSYSDNHVVSNYSESSYPDIVSTQLFKKLRSIIAEKLEIDESKVLPESFFRNDLQADSLDTYELVYAIEEEIGISIPDEKANEFETVLDAYNYILNYRH